MKVVKKNRDTRFAQVMIALNEVFGIGPEPSSIKVEIYSQALSDLSIEAIETATKLIISCRTTATFPKPAEIREAIHGKREDDATRAWALVDKAMRQIGNYDSVNFGDRKIHTVIEMLGGWESLGTLTEDEWKWKRKEFEGLYKAINPAEGPEYLPGVVEKNNVPRGFIDHVKEPFRVGGPMKEPLRIGEEGLHGI